MKLFTLTKRFQADEDGAVTVDWVVLTAAIVGLGIAVYGVVSDGLSTQSTAVSTQLALDHIETDFGDPAAASDGGSGSGSSGSSGSGSSGSGSSGSSNPLPL